MADIEKKIVNSQEALERVHNICKAAHDLIIINLLDIDKGQAWLIQARIISSLFSNFYKMSIEAATNGLENHIRGTQNDANLG